MIDDDTCKIEEKLQDVHLWVHACLKEMKPPEVRKAQEVAWKVIELLNELPCTNPVKFLAIYEVICTGTKMLDLSSYEVDSTVTIH